jgi:hypothetical protein
MYEELTSLKKKQNDLKKSLNGKFKLLRNDFDNWKQQDPPIVLPDNPNKFTQISTHDSNKNLQNQDSKNRNTKKDHFKEKDKLIQLRNELSDLEIGEEVLAKWSDDGWYYRCIIIDKLSSMNNKKYLVEDNLKEREEIWREDIVFNEFKIELHVSLFVFFLIF